MPTQSASTKDGSKRTIAGLGHQLRTATGKAGNLYVDGYEKSIDNVVGIQRKVASSARIDGVQKLLDAQADFVSEVGAATVSASRKILS